MKNIEVTYDVLMLYGIREQAKPPLFCKWRTRWPPNT